MRLRTNMHIDFSQILLCNRQFFLELTTLHFVRKYIHIAYESICHELWLLINYFPINVFSKNQLKKNYIYINKRNYKNKVET